MKMRFSAPATILALLLLVGCGGGGGSDSASGVSYTGSTSQANLSDNNAETIAIAVYQAGEQSSYLTGPMGLAPERAAAGAPRVVTLVRALQSFAGTVSSSGATSVRPLSGAAPKAIQSATETIYDGFGGSAIVSLSVDTETGYFTGSFAFQSWHGDAETVMTGTAHVSGHIDLVGGQFTDMQFTFVSLAMDDPFASITVAGTVSLVGSPTSSHATINLVFRDNLTLKTVWIQNYTMDVVAGPDVAPADGIPDDVEVRVAGRIYLHDHGYVDIDTPVAMHIDAAGTNPSAGTIVVRGSGDRSVRLIVIDDVTGFDLEADLDADGIYEWTSPGHPWA